MILRSWCKLMYLKGKFSKIVSSRIEPINEVSCDICQHVFEQRVCDTNSRNIKWGKQLCGKCIKSEVGKKIANIGAEILRNIPKELKSQICSVAGKKSALSPNAGRFTSERWNNMSFEQQQIQVKKANKALHDKLNCDEEYKNAHYLKIFKNSKIGFISKGHNELHDFLKDYGFIQHHVISNMEVDECNLELKIVVEFNGDMYHCNPRTWKAEDYNKVIKMTAAEKWKLDRNRVFKLKNLGFFTFVVWEDDWALKREEIKAKLLTHIKNNKNETS